MIMTTRIYSLKKLDFVHYKVIKKKLRLLVVQVVSQPLKEQEIFKTTTTDNVIAGYYHLLA